MTINTGYTYDCDEEQRITNLIHQLTDEQIDEAVNLSDGDLGLFERYLTGQLMASLLDPREVMELRSNVISEALKGDDLSSNERAELWSELAEIVTWLQRDDQSIGDYADARTCARFGTQL